jgi:hypothetical protein
MISGDENPDGKMKREKLEDFTNRKNNSAIGIYRYQVNDEEVNKIIETLVQLYESEITFDKELDLASDDQLYCAEMVKKVMEGAASEKIHMGTTIPGPFEARVIANHTKVPLSIMKKREIVAMDNLYMIPNCNLVKKFKW